MAEPERLGWVFLRAVWSHTIQTVGGSLFAVATAVWGLAGWINPDLRMPGFQLWMLGAIAIAFYAFGAFRAWQDERVAKSQVEADCLKFQQKIATELAEIKDSRPQPVIAIRRRSNVDDDDDILVEITNNGAQAEFWVTMNARGDVPPVRGLATWDGTLQTRQLISKGATYSVRIAFSRFYAPKGGPEVHYWSVIAMDGVDKVIVDSKEWSDEDESNPPAFFVDLVVMASPEPISGVIAKEIEFNGDQVSDETGLAAQPV